MATTLRETGQVYVTASAAQSFSDATGEQLEAARRRLTELLLDARRGKDARSGAEQWRHRSRTTGWDITAHVSREGELAVVTYLHIRPYR